MRPDNARISLDEIRKLIRLDPETGYLYWREREVPPNATNGQRGAILRFNAMHAGQRALNHMGGDGYCYGLARGIGLKAHRVAYALHHGHWPVNYIDHVNHVRHDNRPENLRDITHKENSKNRKHYKNNKSGRVGVILTAHETWAAYINVSGKSLGLGTFCTFAEACAARTAAETILSFHEHHGRPLEIEAEAA